MTQQSRKRAARQGPESNSVLAGRKKTSRKLAILLLVAAVATSSILAFGVPDISTLRRSSESLGLWFPLAFWLGYVIFTLFPLPRTVWTVSAGVLFGAWPGLAISLTALTVSSAIAVLAIRSAIGGNISGLYSNPRIRKLNSYLEKRGWVSVFGLRMVAGVPFSFVNYAAALSPIPLGPFLFATAVGSIPTTVLGVFFGEALTGRTSPVLLVVTGLVAVVGIGVIIVDARFNKPKSSL